MKRFAILFVLLTFCLQLQAQNYSFDNLVGYDLLDAGPITSKNEVQGYYLFFTKESSDKKTNDFIIKILDQNLNELTNKEFSATTKTQIEALVFNGKSILLKQFEANGKDLHFTVKNMQVNGEFTDLGEQDIRVSKHSKSDVYAVPEKGFANIYGTKDRKGIIEFYNEEGLQWTYNTPENIKWEEIDYVTTYDDKVIFSIYRYNPVTTGGDYFIKAFQLDSGQQLYEQVLTDFGYDHKIEKGFVNPMQKEIWITGDYYDKGDEEEPENSNGLFIMKVSPQGDILDTDYSPWDGKINRYTKSYKKGKLKDGFIYIHDFVFLDEQKVFGIGEQYRKAFRIWGLAEAAVTVGAYGRLAKVDIGDVLVFKFSPNAKLLETKRNRKRPKTELPNKGLYGGLLIPGKGIGEVMAAQHAFDFSHVSVDNNNESFTVFYNEKEDLSKKQLKRYKRTNRYILRTVTYKNGEYTRDRFYLTDGKSESTVTILPAKPGYVLVNEVSDDYTGLRLEKLK